MKHTISNFNDANEPVMFSNSIHGNFYFDTFFGELDAKMSPLTNSNMHSKLLHCTQIVDPNYILVDSNPTKFCTKLIDPNLWTLYFDGSKNKDGVGVGCLLMDPHGNQNAISLLLGI